MATIFRELVSYKNYLKKKLIFFWIIPTFKCNHKCKLCSAWKNNDGVELNLQMLDKNVLSSNLLNGTTLIIEGGEFFLYSYYEDLLDLIKNRDYVIVTNCSLPDKIIQACEKYKIPKLMISLDGRPDNNKFIRQGSDIKNIINVIKKLQGKTELLINYTISEYNTLDDLRWVMSFVKKMGLKLEINVYNNLSYLSSVPEEKEIYDIKSLIKNPFATHYNLWHTGKLAIPCTSIKYVSSVYPNGNITLCKKKADIVLGNIYNNSLDEIWNSEKTKTLQTDHFNCNDCWLTCQKGYDFEIYYKYGRFFPYSIYKKILKNYIFP